MASSGYRHGYPGQGKAVRQPSLKATVETAAKATGTVLKANDTLKAMAKSLQAGKACKGNKAQLTSQYNGYVKGNSRTDEKTFMRQEQTTATMLVGISGIAASVGGLAIGGAGVTAGAGYLTIGGMTIRNVPAIYRILDGIGKAARVGKITTLINIVEDMKKKVSGDEEEESPKGLIGEEFEDYLTRKLGGSGSFKLGGREFDGGVGNRWWEAKSGQFWEMLEREPAELERFKTAMGHRLRIAQDNGATYELFSNTPIPESIKSWLTKKGIPYTELLE